MRINKFVAQTTGLSRRAADAAITAGRVTINGQSAELGDDINLDTAGVFVRLDDTLLKSPAMTTTIMLHKPVGYVCSRRGQGSSTIYDLLPANLHYLKPVGRLDKDSSGLLLLTNDGQLANELTHPRYAKLKVYEVELDKPLAPSDKRRLEQGVVVEDYTSRLQLAGSAKNWKVSISQGHNRQIRRTFAALGYNVVKLHRTDFGPYTLDQLPVGDHKIITMN